MTENSRPEPNEPEANAAGNAGQRLATKAVHAGEQRLKPAFAITDAIYCALTYTFPRQPGPHRFHRGRSNPARNTPATVTPASRVLERKLAALGGAGRPSSFPAAWRPWSGLLLAKLQSGDEIVMFDECYHRSREFCSVHLEQVWASSPTRCPRPTMRPWRRPSRPARGC